MADSNDNQEEKKGGDIFKKLNIRRREEGDSKPEKREFKPRNEGEDARESTQPAKREFKPRKRDDDSTDSGRPARKEFKPRNSDDENRPAKRYAPRKRDDGLNEEEALDDRVFDSHADKSPIQTKPLIEKKGKKLPKGKFHLVATCMQNLEEELEQELIAIGAEEIDVQKRAIRCVADG